MSRFRHWMLNAVTVLSLLLCIATLALWTRSYHVEERCSYTVGISVCVKRPKFHGGTFDVSMVRMNEYDTTSLKGLIGFDHWFYQDDASIASFNASPDIPGMDHYPAYPVGRYWFAYDLPADPRGKLTLGWSTVEVGHFEIPWVQASRHQLLCIPHWALALVLAILPALRVMFWFRRRKS